MSRLLAVGRLAPLRLRLTADRSLALATAVGMIARVHDRSANRGPDAQPATPARLAEAERAVLRVAHLADRRHADDQHAADLAAREANLGPVAFLRHKLSGVASAAANL